MTLERFPRRTLRGDRVLHRIHRHEKHAWWFSSDGRGRFDPIGTGKGACYWAERPLGAWIEVFRKRMLLAEAEVAARRLCSVAFGRDLRLADLTSHRAAAFAWLRTNDSQAFAVEALAAGFDGIRYLVSAPRIYGVALFGEHAGQPGRDRRIPDELIAEAKAAFGYRVLPPP
jgi:hypothetical protein